MLRLERVAVKSLPLVEGTQMGNHEHAHEYADWVGVSTLPSHIGNIR